MFALQFFTIRIVLPARGNTRPHCTWSHATSAISFFPTWGCQCAVLLESVSSKTPGGRFHTVFLSTKFIVI